jgi:heterodisulfide reductase subunit A
MVKITINDKLLEVPEGTTVLEAARKVGIAIPTLCYYEAVKPYGGCRLCLVEVNQGGRTLLTTSCTYPVSEGLRVVTESPDILEARRLMIDLLLSRCPGVPELQEMARQLGVEKPSFAQGEEDCILCGKCVAVCHELQGAAAIGMVGRGAKKKVMTPFGEFSETCRTCGACEFVCPTGHIKDISAISGKTAKPKLSEFNACLNTRGNITRLYPQAMPSTPAIDRENCVKFLTGNCGACATFCPADAIDYDQKDEKVSLKVGSVILSPGFEPFDPSVYTTYGYKSLPNVVTSIEFERILSASGPFQGHLIRPSDHKEPSKIAWLQCVGSRDINRCDHSYCSAVCCMYAIKEAVIAKEHSKEPLDTAIFYMDMRTYGKDFEKYYNRAEHERGVRFIRSRIHSIEAAEKDNLRLRFATESGEVKEEDFDMVVLSVGLAPLSTASDLARKMGLDLEDHQYAKTSSFSPVNTTREGIYVCGGFREPKDIPQSVMEASASAAASTEMLAEARGSLARSKELPPELDVSGRTPRIGVFVCNCGINIGGIADVPAVRDYAATLPNVVYVEDNLFTCSQDTQEKMKQVIKEKDINRVVVASCSPRTHEPLFQETIRDAGLNKYLFEMANIRDQNTWVHMNDPKAATEKAKDLVRMAVAKAALVEPLEQVMLPVNKAALVVGGGVAGMEAAIGVAEQGLQAYLVEKTNTLGGVAKRLRSTWRGEKISEHLQRLGDKVKSHPRIQLFMETEVKETSGILGNFTTTLAPLDGKRSPVNVDHGATIIATGGREYRPSEYLYGKHPGVLTHLDLDEAILRGDERVKNARTAVFIQCVGSRIPERPYCSKTCCTHSLDSALALKAINPDMNVFVFYRDIRSYGFREDIYREARKKGVIFVRYDLERLPEASAESDGSLSLTVMDHVLGRPIRIAPDLLVLAVAILPNENKRLFEMFKVPVNTEGFLIEAHAKLRPVDFASEGLFMAGLAHYPKPIDETITQAKAAVARAMTILSKESIYVGGVVASVNSDKCAACLTCVRTCPYGAPSIGEEGYAIIDPAACRGCGACVAECPGKAIALKHFTDEQILAKTDALFQAQSA